MITFEHIKCTFAIGRSILPLGKLAVAIKPDLVAKTGVVIDYEESHTRADIKGITFRALIRAYGHICAIFKGCHWWRILSPVEADGPVAAGGCRALRDSVINGTGAGADRAGFTKNVITVPDFIVDRAL